MTGLHAAGCGTWNGMKNTRWHPAALHSPLYMPVRLLHLTHSRKYVRLPLPAMTVMSSVIDIGVNVVYLLKAQCVGRPACTPVSQLEGRRGEEEKLLSLVVGGIFWNLSFHHSTTWVGAIYLNLEHIVCTPSHGCTYSLGAIADFLIAFCGAAFHWEVATRCAFTFYAAGACNATVCGFFAMAGTIPTLPSACFLILHLISPPLPALLPVLLTARFGICAAPTGCRTHATDTVRSRAQPYTGVRLPYSMLRFAPLRVACLFPCRLHSFLVLFAFYHTLPCLTWLRLLHYYLVFYYLDAGLMPTLLPCNYPCDMDIRFI